MTISRKFVISSALAAALLGFGAASQAQMMGGYYGPGCGGWHQGPDGYYGMMGPGCAWGWGPQQGNGPRGNWNYQDRKTYMLGALNLSDNQKSAWNNYSQAIDAVHNARSNQQLDPNASRQDRLNARIDSLKDQTAALEALTKARNEFVKVLSPEQVAVLDQFESGSYHGVRGFHHGRGPANMGAQQRGPKGPAK